MYELVKPKFSRPVQRQRPQTAVVNKKSRQEAIKTKEVTLSTFSKAKQSKLVEAKKDSELLSGTEKGKL